MAGLEKQMIDEKKIEGVTYRIYRYRERRSVVRLFPVPVPVGAPAGTPNMHPYVHDVVVHQVCAIIDNSSVILEPGALQSFKGRIKVEVMKHEPGKSWISRKIASAGTGESPYGVRYTGTGEIWMEPASKNFVIVEMDAETPMLLDDKAFYSCSGKISVGTKRNTTVAGMMAGNELVQPLLRGVGIAVIESPVPEDELVFVDLDGTDQLVVDGDYMLFYSESLELKLGPLVPGLLDMKRSGEGLVFTFSGTGRVCLMPTSRISS